jgi:hypothetical protein
MTDTFAYRIRVWAVPLFAALYCMVAGVPALLHLGSGEEKYLAYHFFVFTEVPAREQTAYAVYVTAIKGNPVKAIPIEDAGVLLADEWRNRPEYQRRINALGREVASGAGGSRGDFEALITVRPLTYEIREIRYNPIDHYGTGAVISETTLESFTVR